MIILSDLDLKALEECDSGCLALKEIHALEDIIKKHSDGWAYAKKMDVLRQQAEAERRELRRKLIAKLVTAALLLKNEHSCTMKDNGECEMCESIDWLISEEEDDKTKTKHVATSSL